MKLVCWKCKQNSIPAPPGATEKTRYVCPACSPENEVHDDLDFQRFTDDPRVCPGNLMPAERRVMFFAELFHRGDKGDGTRKVGHATDGRVEFDRIPDDVQRDWRFIKKSIRKFGLPKSLTVEQAKTSGETWVQAATVDNILRLPRKYGLPILWRYWGGLGNLEIARAMGWSTRQATTMALRRAKELLAESVTRSAVTINQVGGSKPTKADAA